MNHSSVGDIYPLHTMSDNLKFAPRMENESFLLRGVSLYTHNTVIYAPNSLLRCSWAMALDVVWEATSRILHAALGLGGPGTQVV